MMKIDLYEARESFVTMLDGEQVAVSRGDLVRKGHPLLKGRDELFRPAEGYIRFDVEQATAAPGEKRGGSRRKKKASVEQATAAPGETRQPGKSGK
jgi:hypothetical protein